MQKLTTKDVYPPRVYEGMRDDLRRRIIAIKQARRIALGPDVSVVFENRATMIFQVCEMMRAERLDTDEKVQAEIDVYNTLLPEPGELAATLFVEITQSDDIRPTLHRLVGIDEHVALRVGDERIAARFEAGRSEADRISSVQYIRFPLSPSAQAALRTPGARVTLGCDLADYRHETVLSDESRASLAADLD